MPVGTQATVKGLTPELVRDAGRRDHPRQHLPPRPAARRRTRSPSSAACTGSWTGTARSSPTPAASRSSAWPRRSARSPTTASTFRSHIDGALLELTPERAVAIQENLGSDIAMCLDECPPARRDPDDDARRRRRTIRWAERCRKAHTRADQALFAIVQGGTEPRPARPSAPRRWSRWTSPATPSAASASARRRSRCTRPCRPCAALLPDDKPRYLMGVGRPQDLLAGVAAGIDMFDCVMPTRNGRNAAGFTADGPIRLRNASHRRDPAPVESGCPCYTLPQLQPGVPAPPVRRRTRCSGRPCCRCTTSRSTCG